MTRRKSPLESYQTDPVDDPEAPELSEEDFKRMRPASELPKKMLDSFPRMRGRPPKSLEERKVQVTLRLHPMIVAHFKSTGPGWQTRMEQALIDVAFHESEPVKSKGPFNPLSAKPSKADVAKRKGPVKVSAVAKRFRGAHKGTAAIKTARRSG
jgi:uncharacterized protein (DUF4415 family)